MKRIPDKVREGIAIGLFIWSIVAIIVTIVYLQYDFQLWIVITMPILAVLAFIISIVFMPTSKKEEATKEHKVHHNKRTAPQRKRKKKRKDTEI